MLSGLRAGELQALTRDHLDAELCGLRLDARWTKNKRRGFQPLPERLVKRFSECPEIGFVAQLYRMRNSYVALAVEAGANVKELQTLARHRTPDLSQERALQASGVERDRS